METTHRTRTTLWGKNLWPVSLENHDQTSISNRNWSQVFMILVRCRCLQDLLSHCLFQYFIIYEVTEEILQWKDFKIKYSKYRLLTDISIIRVTIKTAVGKFNTFLWCRASFGVFKVAKKQADILGRRATTTNHHDVTKPCVFFNTN